MGDKNKNSAKDVLSIAKVSEKYTHLDSTAKDNSPFIVVLGASTGGLGSFELFFKNMPLSSGMTFIVITRLDPDQQGILPDLLARYTKMPVRFILDGKKPHPDTVLVLPPGKNLVIQQGILKLVKQDITETTHCSIDFFLHSLAVDQGPRTVCILLSGISNDSSSGILALRDKGGLIIAQNIKPARFDGIPKYTINAGLADYILEPEKIPTCLMQYKKYFTHHNIIPTEYLTDEIQQILFLLRKHIGHDFSVYKPNTIIRRIQKRMLIKQIETIPLYAHYLNQHPQEIDILFKELLINVTSFFRDPEAFESLKQLLLSHVLINKPKGSLIRVWVPGCATGEEAYSIAILLQECMQVLKRQFTAQIFGTDIDDDAIEIARSGVYPESIANDVSPERLRAFFTKDHQTYKIHKDIRKMLIFAPQSVIKDPPFTKLDLLTCRNLLIYLNSQIQKKLLPLFHYSLQLEGLLFLGNSETIGNSVDLFTAIDRKWKIFKRKSVPSSIQSVINFPSSKPKTESTRVRSIGKYMQLDQPKLSQLVEKMLLDKYAPACVIIDKDHNIIYIHGKTSKYLEFASGEARLNIFEMARVDLRPKIIAAINRAAAQKKEVCYMGLQLKEEKEFKYINLKVCPLTELESNQQTLQLVIFEDVALIEPLEVHKGKHASKSELDKRISQLEQELKYSKESLQTIVEELETSNEELKSSNEELQSTNEELQSTNEEIETSKEELQSLNEELSTVNAELENRIEQLSSANSDIKNLLDNAEIATIFLDESLCVKRFTPKVTAIFHLIAADIGRPINHIVSNLDYKNLIEDVKAVLQTLIPKIIEAQDKNGHWYLIRIIPYRTITNIINGAIITFLDIQTQKQAEEKLARLTADLNEASQLNERILNKQKEPVLLLDSKLCITMVNDACCALYQTSYENLVNQSFYKLPFDQGSTAKLEKLFEKAFTANFTSTTAVITHLHQNGDKELMVNIEKLSKQQLLLTFKHPEVHSNQSVIGMGSAF